MQGRGHRASARACTHADRRLCFRFVLSEAQATTRPRLSLLGNSVENIKGTVFRQTQVADFELRAHEMVEKGQRLTSEPLDKYADAVAWHPFRDATPSTCPHTDAGSIRRTPTCGSRNRSARAYPAARAFSDRRVC